MDPTDPPQRGLKPRAMTQNPHHHNRMQRAAIALLVTLGLLASATAPHLALAQDKKDEKKADAKKDEKKSPAKTEKKPEPKPAEKKPEPKPAEKKPEPKP